jgi:uncharacterized membrane-anchored protein
MDEKTQNKRKQMDKNKKMNLVMDIMFLTIIAITAVILSLQLLEKADLGAMRLVIIGSNAGLVFIVFYSTYRKHTKIVESPYERYCAQIVDGQMTEFPTNIVKKSTPLILD